MKVYEYNPKKPLGLRNTAVALGFFDGVHIAHRRLLEKTVKVGAELGLAPTVFTFTAEGGIKSSAPRLYSTKERLEILSELGIENVILVDFSAIAGLSAEDFINVSLIDHFGAKAAIAGYNFRFGKGAMGDGKMLTELMEKAGCHAYIEEEISYRGMTVSSTLIRSYLTEGKVSEAREILGAPYFISGKVESGNRQGKKLGFPTINVPLLDGQIQLKRGVYLTGVKIGNKIYRGLTNVGTCPTFIERDLHTETYILDYNSEIYGEEVKIFFIEFLRNEIKFESPDDLKLEVESNIRWAMERDIKWQEIGLK